MFLLLHLETHVCESCYRNKMYYYYAGISGEAKPKAFLCHHNNVFGSRSDDADESYWSRKRSNKII